MDEGKMSRFDGVVWCLMKVFLREVRPTLRKEAKVILERMPL